MIVGTAVPTISVGTTVPTMNEGTKISLAAVPTTLVETVVTTIIVGTTIPTILWWLFQQILLEQLFLQMLLEDWSNYKTKSKFFLRGNEQKKYYQGRVDIATIAVSNIVVTTCYPTLPNTNDLPGLISNIISPPK